MTGFDFLINVIVVIIFFNLFLITFVIFKILNNLLKASKQIRVVVEKNEKEFDSIIKNIDGTILEVNKLTEEVNVAMPDIQGTIANVEKITSDVTIMTDTAKDITKTTKEAVEKLDGSIVKAKEDMEVVKDTFGKISKIMGDKDEN